MPTLPIPVRREAASQTGQPPGNHIEISTTALAFLIPLFAIFIFGPIALVLFVRNRRGSGRNVVGPRRYLFAVSGRSVERLSQSQARRVLAEYTEVVPCGQEAREMNEKRKVGEKEEEAGVEEKERADGRGCGHGHERDHDHAEDESSVMERECAICLSPLYFPSPPAPAKLPLRLSSLKNPTSSPTDPVPLDPRSSQASTILATTTTTSSSSRPPSLNPEAEEILRLNICSHEFHAECLVGWFVIGKFSCPICRAVYFGKGKEGKGKGGEGEREGEGSVATRTGTGVGANEESEGSGGERRREEV